MSRCFPFPPPGYEKEIRPNEADPPPVKSQEKPKEKKHKKEKKDKEKKEKKDKETSKDKHKEKKDKKDKHKDRKDKNRDKDKKRTSEEKDAKVLPNTGDREKLATNSLQDNSNGESKFIEDLARRIREEDEATESQSAQKINSPCGKISGVTGTAVKNNISCQVPQTNHRKDDDKRINNHKNLSMAKRSENVVPQVPSCLDQKRAEVMVKPMEKRDQAKQTELQLKNHYKESVTKGDKPWDKEGLKKNELKSIDKSKEKEVITEVINNIGQKKPKFVEGGPRLKEKEQNSVDTRNFRVQDLSKGSVVKNHTNEGTLGKRKGLEADGLLYENGSRPNKMQKPVASPVLVNGRKLGSCQTKPNATSEHQRSACIPEVKEHRINGFIDVQEPKSRPPIPQGATMKPLVKENGEASVKRPHSDLKYLDQILNVPKRKEMHEVDEDQEWLFGQSGAKSKKRKTESSELYETPQVWNQALRVESADIIALPYVAPF